MGYELNEYQKKALAPIRILVCGGRDFKDQQYFNDCMGGVCEINTTIIQGEAKGADSMAKQYARDWGFICESYPANWAKYGKKAGYLRNKQMLDEGKPDIVVAFPGGKGTKMMVELAKKYNIEVREF
jgi:hypothetical protein